MVALLNNTLSTSFLESFPCRGKGKGPGTKVEHTVIYVLGQYSKKYRASFILQVNVKIFLKRTFNGGVNQPTFLHYCLLQGAKWPREITISLFSIRNVVLFWNCAFENKYIFNIYPKRRGGAVAYERLPQSEIRLYTEICKFKWIFIFYFQPCRKILLTVNDITISEPHYLLFYSAGCKYTAAIRQR